jgi:membrane protease YdiL (CAAX protease family)
MGILPFLLAAIAPRAAGFDCQWLPKAWSHWLWFLAMLVLLYACGVLPALLVSLLPIKYTPPVINPALFPDWTVTGVYVLGIVMVLLTPVAEEIFFRGYLLEQLRKVTPSGVALLIQSIVFALGHLPIVAPRAGGFQAAIAAFFYGIILGVWRIRFRSLIPLILAHMILAGLASFNVLTKAYEGADFVAKVGFPPPDFGAKTRSSPKCRQIYLLTKEPSGKAVPAIIDILADDDFVVRWY